MTFVIAFAVLAVGAGVLWAVLSFRANARAEEELAAELRELREASTAMSDEMRLQALRVATESARSAANLKNTSESLRDAGETLGRYAIRFAIPEVSSHQARQPDISWGDRVIALMKASQRVMGDRDRAVSVAIRMLDESPEIVYEDPGTLLDAVHRQAGETNVGQEISASARHLTPSSSTRVAFNVSTYWSRFFDIHALPPSSSQGEDPWFGITSKGNAPWHDTYLWKTKHQDPRVDLIVNRKKRFAKTDTAA